MRAQIEVIRNHEKRFGKILQWPFNLNSRQNKWETHKKLKEITYFKLEGVLVKHLVTKGK